MTKAITIIQTRRSATGFGLVHPHHSVLKQLKLLSCLYIYIYGSNPLVKTYVRLLYFQFLSSIHCIVMSQSRDEYLSGQLSS